ncbi:MAG: hypothetical protein ACOYNZ_10405 [Rhodoferax sp.]
MIVFTRTVSIAPGKASSAVGYAHQIAAYIKTSVGTELEVLLPIGGNPNRITWSGRYTNLAEFEESQSKMAADERYMHLVASGTDLFMAGSVFDTLWRVV